MNVGTVAKAQIVLTKISKITRAYRALNCSHSSNVCTIPLATRVQIEMCEKSNQKSHVITLLAKFITALYTGIKGGKNYLIPFGTFMNVSTLTKA